MEVRAVDAGAAGPEARGAVTGGSSPKPRLAATEADELTREWRPLASLEPERQAWRGLSERAAEPNVFYDLAFALAAAPVLGARVQVALSWSRTQPRQLLSFFPIRRARLCGPLWPVALGWAHAFAPLGTPLVDRDFADPVIDAFLSGLAGADRAAPFVRLSFWSTARLRQLSTACLPGEAAPARGSAAKTAPRWRPARSARAI
jgi:hypothetical protein